MAKRRFLFRRLINLLLIGAVVLVGVYVIKKNPGEKLKRIVYPNDIKVMTYNIHHGEGTDGIYSLSRIARVIRKQSPHLVCLNEVDYKTERTFGDEQVRKIAADLGMDFTFARNLEFQGGWYGNAILSRFPIEFAENKIYKCKDSPERRGVLHTIVKIGDKKVHFYATHLSVDSLESADEGKELLNVILDWGTEEPIIIAGDFNMEPSFQRIHEFSYYFYDIGYFLEPGGYTFPSDNPQVRIDYIFSNDLLAPISVDVIKNENTIVASDHLPLVVHFKFKEE